MAPNTTNRRMLATSDPNLKTSISLDPTHKKQPKTYPQDPYVPSNNNTIDKISNKFSQLYLNHKNLKNSSGHSYSLDDNPLKVKSWTSTALTKSKSQHETSIQESNNDDHDIEIKKVSSVNRGKEFYKESEKGLVKNQSLLSLPLVNGEKRKSLCSEKIELGDFLSCNGVKVVAVDMPPSMQIHAVNCARKIHDSLEKFSSKALALTLKKEFDGVYGPAWHCIVGTSFGSFVTHSVGGFIYFSMDHKIYVLLFKTAVQKAESS